MSTMNVSLPLQLKAWVEHHAASGMYSNTSDYVRDLILRDQVRDTARAALQSEVDAGISSGPAEEFDPDAFKTRMHSLHGE